jgi:RNA recognition motif-containing protein
MITPMQVSTTNVYIKGLRADTTDAFLVNLGQKYGAIKSAKAIIDRATQQCRGLFDFCF